MIYESFLGEINTGLSDRLVLGFVMGVKEAKSM